MSEISRLPMEKRSIIYAKYRSLRLQRFCFEVMVKLTIL
jgi:hypothetical protein